MDGIVAARLAGNFSVIHGEHGWDLNDTNGLNKKRILVRRFLSRCVYEYICVSKDMEQWLKNKVRVCKQVTQIYNGVDIQRFAPKRTNNKLRVSLGLADNEVVVGIVARLDPIKNHPLLLRAFDNIKKDYQNTRLLVIGDGPDKKRLESLAGGNVLFLGNRADIPEILRILDIFVLPSLNEGISNTILEAMATGIPVIASNVGGNSELVKNGVTGMLVESGSLEGLISALRVYLDNKHLRSSNGEMARVHIKNNFSIQAMVDAYEKVYKRISTSLNQPASSTA
jgi:sugar transferase (PEP-CTERM/EpsH1 system associated)